MSGFRVDPDLLAGHAVERDLAADRVAAHPLPAAAPEGSFGVIGEVFALGVRAAAEAGAHAVGETVAQFRLVADELAAAAAAYRAADGAAAVGLAAAPSDPRSGS